MTAITATAQFDMGRVISRTFGAIGKNLPVFVLLTVLLYAVPQFILQLAINQGADAGSVSAQLSRGLLALVGGLATFVLYYVLQACLVKGTVTFLRGQPASVGGSLKTGFGVFLALFALTLLIGVLEVLGFIALFVPGIILMLRWSVAVPVLVAERGRGISGSMARSAELTKGHRWSIFGLMVVVGIVMWLVSAVGMAIGFGVNSALGLSGDGPAGFVAGIKSPVVIGFNVLIGSLVFMVAAVGVASLYYELRSLKEGVSATDLAAVFD
jgi:hypothetical protein